MIVRIDHAVPLLLEFSGSSNKKVSETALLVLRNLCFYVPSKALLLSNGKYDKDLSSNFAFKAKLSSFRINANDSLL